MIPALLALILLLSLPALACALPGQAEPTATPTALPTQAPPTEPPPTSTTAPTEVPTEAPTQAPSPTTAPTEKPAATATQVATAAPPRPRPTIAPTAESRVIEGEELDPDLEPGFGEVELSAGFGPDPFTVAVIAGGDISVGALELGVGCTGYAVSSPDFRLNWDGETEFLRIFFEAETLGSDATLIVNDPNGEWLCNDDYENLNPLVQINDPQAGQYEIWVGSFSSGVLINGFLNVTELDIGPEAGVTGELDFNLDPTYGTENLSPGFSPDPWPVSVTAGGPVAAGALGLGAGCLGYTASAPDFRVNWEGSTDRLRFFFQPDSEGHDPTLIMFTPSGEWLCNDDFESLDPLVEIVDPEDGPYDIWVGSYTPNDTMAGTLYVTELNFGPGSLPGQDDDQGILDPTLEPAYGTDTLAGGFPDDPYSVEVLAGGSVDVGAQDLGPDCYGYAASRPDFRLNWSGTTDFFRIFFLAAFSDDDTILIVNDPNGNWHCNDDFEDLNPLLEFENPAAGPYDIWVATFSPDVPVIGILYITEVAIGPGDVSAATGFPPMAHSPATRPQAV